MAYPQSPHQPADHGSASAPAIASSSVSRTPLCRVQAGGTPGEHQLEKLEFALAIALTRGDQSRSADLRRQIDALGGNHEEPGT